MDKDFDVQSVIGMPVPMAEYVSGLFGYTIREESKDGGLFRGTCDYVESRIRVNTVDSIITEARLG